MSESKSYIEVDQENRDFAVNARNCNVLLSAAAGSGKTTTLVKRIVTRLLNKEENVSIDKLLVVTFTNAAAAELRTRIGEELGNAFDEAIKIGDDATAENAYRQKLLLHKASIGTIDSFCLEVVKKNFVKAGIEPIFRIDDKEVEIITDDIMESVLEEYYADKESEDYAVLRKLVDMFCSIHSDDTLKSDIIRPVYRYAVNFEEPHKWLLHIEENYAKQEVWYDYIKDTLSKMCREIISHIDEILSFLTSEERITESGLPNAQKYIEVFLSDKGAFENIVELLKEDGSLFKTTFEVGFQKFVTKTAAEKAGYTAGCVHAVLAKERDKYKKYYNDELKNLMKWRETGGEETVSEDEMQRLFARGIESCGKYMRVLCRITDKVICLAEEKMHSRRIYNFSQIEHIAYDILCDEEVAAAYRNSFDEIYIDEYQDTSALQENILNRVSKAKDGINNIFMVGDVKQSIYGFRYAKPDYFIQKYNLYRENPEKGALRILSRNFRSRKPVLDAVNLVFKAVMRQDVCEIAYTEDEFLNYGAIQQYDGNPLSDEYKGKAELHIAPSLSSEEKQQDSIRAQYGDEALFITDKIISLFENGFKVFDKKCGMRPIRFSDIAIISRTNKSIKHISKTLSDFGIPVETASDETIFDRNEVNTVLDFLRIIDNPCQDIPLVSVLRSGYYNFDDRMLAEIRLLGAESGCFYNALKRAEKCCSDDVLLKKTTQFLKDVEFFRELSRVESLSRLAWVVINHNHYYEKNGSEGKGNLRLLLELTYKYDSGEKAGLYNFICYINSLASMEKKDVYAYATATSGDRVQVMTIHHSKGLEYPVLFIYASNSVSPVKNKIFLDEKLGMGINFIADSDIHGGMRVIRNSAALCALKDLTKRNELAEEQRLLYVAMTRAREKLYVTATDKEYYNSFEIYRDGTAPFVSNLAARTATTYLDMIAVSVFSKEAESAWEICRIKNVEDKLCAGTAKARLESLTFVGKNSDESIVGERSKEQALGTSCDDIATENNAIAELQNLFDEFDDGRLPAKLSVSSLKQIAADFSDEYDISLETKVSMKSLKKKEPACETGKSKLSSAKQGTLIHKCLQFLLKERSKWPEAENGTLPTKEQVYDYITEFCERMRDGKILSNTEFDCVEKDILVRFLTMPRAMEIKHADFVCSETAFTFFTDIKKYLGNSSALGSEKELTATIQGIIDLYYKYNDTLVIVDFKTDRVNENNIKELCDKYSVQLRCYRDAFENITDMKAEQSVLMFLRSGTEYIVE